jgi:mRNA interferase MazF
MSEPRPALYPRRGEIWLADLDPTRGREQAGTRPVLVLSEDIFNASAADLVIAWPITSVLRPIPSHLRVDPPEGGLRQPSAIMIEAVRSLSRQRLYTRWGSVEEGTMLRAARILRTLTGM